MKEHFKNNPVSLDGLKNLWTESSFWDLNVVGINERIVYWNKANIKLCSNWAGSIRSCCVPTFVNNHMSSILENVCFFTVMKGQMEMGLRKDNRYHSSIMVSFQWQPGGYWLENFAAPEEHAGGLLRRSNSDSSLRGSHQRWSQLSLPSNMTSITTTWSPLGSQIHNQAWLFDFL